MNDAEERSISSASFIIMVVAVDELESAGAGEGGWVWVGATEAAVEIHWLVAATHLEDVLAE